MKIRSAFLLQVATASIPSLILLSVVPVVKSRLGIDAFAGFAVIVSAIGLLSILDGGLGRSVTYFVSMARTKGGVRSAHAAVIGGMAVGFGLAIVVMVAGAALLGFLNGESFLIARNALCILLAFCPAFIACSVLKGALEGQQRFALSAALQLSHGALIGIAPLLLIAHSDDISFYAWVVGVARISLMGALLYATGLALPSFFSLVRSVGVHSHRIFQYSKWLFFSNIIGLCIIFADRFVIAGYFNSSVVAAYLLTMELISRGQLLVGAFCSVIFPKLVTHVQRATSLDFAGLIRDAQGLVITANLAIGFVSVPLMEPMMSWWLGHTLAPQAAQIALVGIVGLALVSSSSISMLAINSMGHTRQVAILHASELPLYFALLYVATVQMSLQILLAAWLFRLVIDAFGMEMILHSLVKKATVRLVTDAAKDVFRWPLLITLIFALLALIFCGPFISSTSSLYWAAAGAACSIAFFVNFVLRLKNLIAQPLTMSRPDS